MKTWLTVTEAAEYAGVSRDTIYTACEQRELGHARIGGRRAIRLKLQWIDAWLERHALAVQERAAVEDRTPPERNRQIPTSNCATLEAPRILDTRIADRGRVVGYRTTGRGRRHRGASGKSDERLVRSQRRNGHDAG